MVEEVLEDVHHVGGHVVEGDGRVAAAGRAVGLGDGEAQGLQTKNYRELGDNIVLKGEGGVISHQHFFLGGLPWEEKEEFNLRIFAVGEVSSILIASAWDGNIDRTQERKHLTWEKVLLWVPDHEASPTPRVPGVSRGHVQLG